jgi:uncharacterized protein YaaW (UPF0174 family)
MAPRLMRLISEESARVSPGVLALLLELNDDVHRCVCLGGCGSGSLTLELMNLVALESARDGLSNGGKIVVWRCVLTVLWGPISDSLIF